MTKKYLWDTSNTKYYRKQLRHVNWRGPEKKKTGAKIFRPQKKKSMQYMKPNIPFILVYDTELFV